MKTFITNDFYFQSMLVSLLLVFSVSSSTRGLAIVIYFLIALNHLISANRKMFSAWYRKSIVFKIYYAVSMVFLMTLFSQVLCSEIKAVDHLWQAYGTGIISFAMCGTPFLALIYYLICLNDYRKEIRHNIKSLQKD